MKKYTGQKFLTAIMLLVVFAFLSTNAFAAYSVKQVYARFSAVAAETLATGEVVMLKTDGLAYQADANDAALRPAIGIVGKGGSAGDTVEIVTIGVLSGWSSLTEGAPGYLSETAAAVTQSAPSYSQQVGQAITDDSYMFNFQNYFDSSSLTVLGTLSGASPLVLEGATANDFETTIAVTDPTADNTQTIQNRSGYIQVDSAPMTAAVVLTPAAAVTLTVGQSKIYTDLVTDNENQTITFSGAGAAGDEITIIFTTAGSADEVITFHSTLVSSTGTLTLGTDAGKFYVVRFISDGSHWYEVSRTAVQT